MFQVGARDEAGCANNFLPRVAVLNFKKLGGYLNL